VVLVQPKSEEYLRYSLLYCIKYFNKIQVSAAGGGRIFTVVKPNKIEIAGEGWRKGPAQD
jgi:hypothetical protein